MEQLIGRRVQFTFPEKDSLGRVCVLFEAQGVILAADSVSFDVQPDEGGEVCRVSHADVVLVEELGDVSKANPNAVKSRESEAVEFLVAGGMSKTKAKAAVKADGAEAILAVRDGGGAPAPAASTEASDEKKSDGGNESAAAPDGQPAATDGAAPGAAMVAG